MLFLISGYASLLNAEASVVASEIRDQILANLVGDKELGGKIGNDLVTSTSSSDAFTTLLDSHDDPKHDFVDYTIS